MRKYIKAYENYIPICIEEGQNVALIDVNEEAMNYCSLDSSTQFNYSKIINEEFSRHPYNSRLRSFAMGKGIVSLLYGRMMAVICRDGFVLINSDWRNYYPTEFKRLKQCLTEAGYKTRNHKCFVFVDDLEETITINPIKPVMNDYLPETQLATSSEFLAQERAILNISIKEAIPESMRNSVEVIEEDFNEIL